MSTRVAVILCAHLTERAQQLAEAVQSLRHQTRMPDEIVVVVDGNPELAALLRAGVADVTLVELERRGGLALARNAGVASCEGDTLLFLDDDAVADPRWVELLAAAVEEDGVLGASGRSNAIWGGARPAWLADEFLWTVGCSYAGQPTSRSRVRNVYGGCCGLRRELFAALGGYDPRLGRSPTSAGGGEEAELCLRASERWPGRTFTYEPAAVIGHHVPAARLTVRYILRRAYDEGRMKATVGRLHKGGLSPERHFAGALPRAIARDLLRAARGELRHGARALGSAVIAAAVLAGLAAGAVGQLARDPGAGPAVAREDRRGVPVA